MFRMNLLFKSVHENEIFKNIGCNILLQAEYLAYDGVLRHIICIELNDIIF